MRCDDCRARDLAIGDTFTCMICGEQWQLFTGWQGAIWEDSEATARRIALDKQAIKYKTRDDIPKDAE